jgi:ABC-type uncharacterized transport system auxiliary subunit
LPKLIQTKLIESFENAQSLAVARRSEGENADYQLLIAARAFQIELLPQPTG